MGVKQFRFTIEGVSGDLEFTATFAASNNFIFTIMEEIIKFKPYLYSQIVEAKIAALRSVLDPNQQNLFSSILLMKKEELKSINPQLTASDLQMIDLYMK